MYNSMRYIKLVNEGLTFNGDWDSANPAASDGQGASEPLPEEGSQLHL